MLFSGLTSADGNLSRPIGEVGVGYNNEVGVESSANRLHRPGQESGRVDEAGPMSYADLFKLLDIHHVVRRRY